MLSLREFMGMGSGDDDVVSVKIGDLKRLIREKNTAIIEYSKMETVNRNLKDTIQTVNGLNADLVSEVDELKFTIRNGVKELSKARRTQEQLEVLKDKLDLANGLIEAKNARLTASEFIKPPLVDIYG